MIYMKISLNVENRNDYTNNNVERITILSRIEIKYDVCVYQAEGKKRQLYCVTPIKCFWNLFCQLKFLEVFLYSIYHRSRITELVHTS